MIQWRVTAWKGMGDRAEQEQHRAIVVLSSRRLFAVSYVLRKDALEGCRRRGMNAIFGCSLSCRDGQSNKDGCEA